MTVDEIFRQQEFLVEKLLNFDLKKCINYVVSLNNDEELKSIPGRYTIDQISDKKMV